MKALATQAGAAMRLDESRLIEATCAQILLPFIEAARRAHPFHRGVLTAIRPVGAPSPRFDLPPFIPFVVAARFADRSEAGDLRAPEVLSLIHAVDEFQLNMLFVAHRQAVVYRYGLVLESPAPLPAAEADAIFEAAARQPQLGNLEIEHAPVADPPDATPPVKGGRPALLFEAHRTLAAEQYVKLYFRNRFA